MLPLVLGLGNELLGDDGIGIVVGRQLTRHLCGLADVELSSLHGVALLDLLVGREYLVIVDAIRTNSVPPGAIIELGPEDLRAVNAPSPHFSGLPEIFTLAREMDLTFPGHVKIFAVEITESNHICEALSEPVAAVVEEVVARVLACIHQWREIETSTNPGGGNA